jgi:hypothetical protein
MNPSRNAPCTAIVIAASGHLRWGGSAGLDLGMRLPQ